MLARHGFLTKVEGMRTFSVFLAFALLSVAAGCIGDPFGAPSSPDRSTTAAKPKSRRQQAFETIRKWKGEVQVDADDPDKAVIRLDLHSIPSAVAILDALGPLPKLRELNLFETTFTDADMARLRTLTNLQMLNLSATYVTDAGLAYLQSLPNLRKLYLNDTRVTDTGLPYLRGLTNLTDLGLFRTAVTDDGLTQLAALTKLQKLTLGGSAITDRSLFFLRRFTDLQELYVYTTRVSTSGIDNLKFALPHLKVFH